MLRKAFSILCLYISTVVVFSLQGVAQPLQLELVDAINLTLDNNLTLMQSQIGIRLSENDVDSTKSAYGFTLSGRVNGTSSIGSKDDNFWESRTSSESLSGGLTLGYGIYDGGTRDAKYEQAVLNLEASEMDHDRSRQELLYQVVFQYLDVLINTKQVAIQHEDLSIAESDLKRIQLDFENGIRIESEVLRQEAAVAELNGQLVEVNRRRTNSLISLKTLLNISVLSEVAIPESEYRWLEGINLSEPRLELSLSRIMDRPDLMAQSSRVQSAVKGIKISENGNHFTVNATADVSSSFSNSFSGESFNQQIFERHPSAGIGLTLNIPILDRAQTRTSIVRSKLQLRQEELQLQTLLQTAEATLLQAWSNYDSAAAKLEASQAQFRSAEKALDAERNRFEAGAATLLDLNTLRTTRLNAALGVEEARFDLFVARLQIALADGGIEGFLTKQTQQNFLAAQES